MTDKLTHREDEEGRLDTYTEVSKALDEYASQLSAQDRAALYNRVCEIISDWGDVVGGGVLSSMRQ